MVTTQNFKVSASDAQEPSFRDGLFQKTKQKKKQKKMSDEKRKDRISGKGGEGRGGEGREGKGNLNSTIHKDSSRTVRIQINNVKLIFFGSVVVHHLRRKGEEVNGNLLFGGKQKIKRCVPE